MDTSSGLGTIMLLMLPQEEGERGGQKRKELELIHQVIVKRHVMRMRDRRKKHSHQPEHHCVEATAK